MATSTFLIVSDVQFLRSLHGGATVSHEKHNYMYFTYEFDSSSTGHTHLDTAFNSKFHDSTIHNNCNYWRIREMS